MSTLAARPLHAVEPAPSASVAPDRPRRRHHVHLPGAVFVLVTLGIALGAFNTQNNLLFWCLGLGITAVLVSGVVNARSLMALRVDREVLGSPTLGGPVTIRYRVANISRFMPAFAVVLRERPARGEHLRLALPPADIPYLGPRRVLEVTLTGRALRRGQAILDEVRLSTAFPFGISRKSVTYSRPCRVLVRPPVLPIRDGLLDPPPRRGQGSDVSAAAPGQGVDFFAVREYRPGDYPRRIAWKPTARTGELRIAQTAAVLPPRVHLELDLGDGATDESALEASICLAASVLAEALRIGHAAAFSVPSAGIFFPSRAGARQLAEILDALARLEIEPHASLHRPDLPATAAGADTARARRIVIHAGATPAGSPDGTRHLSALRAQDVLRQPEALATLLGLARPPRAVRWLAAPAWLTRRFGAAGSTRGGGT